MATIVRRSLLAGLAVAGLARPHIARATMRIVRIGHSNTERSQFGIATRVFADAVTADPTIGQLLKIEAHGNSELGDDPSMLKACMAGTLDSVLMAGSIMSNAVPELGVLNAPFLFRDVAGARAVLDGHVGTELIALAARRGLHILAWAENGLRQITADRPIRAIGDLRGLKLRVPQSPAILDGFKALGADAKPLAFSLVRNALATGEFHGQENPVITIEANKFYEVQKYLSLTGHIYDAAAFVISADLAEDMSVAQRSALTRAAGKGAQAMRLASSESQAEVIARLRAAGMIVVTDIDFSGFRAAARPFIADLGLKFPVPEVKALLAAVG